MPANQKPSVNQKPPTNIEALDQVQDAVVHVLTLVSAVLRKFPGNTVPDALRPFWYVGRNYAVRRSVKDGEIVLVSTSLFDKNTTLRFPLELLDAPEQVITRWARDQYWSGIEGSKHQERQTARVNATKAREAMEQAQRNYEAAQERLSAVWAPGKKKRRAADRGASS